MEILKETYFDKKIIITGHTGFKGSWLSLWLSLLGAEVIGLSKEIVHPKGLYSSLNEKSIFSQEYFIDVINQNKLQNAIKEVQPDFIFHLAAQPIVSIAYSNPSLTFYSNAIGTMNILESIKTIEKDINLVLITSDKCYENVETFYGYKETDKLGGKDPYSASKACAEIISNCYSRSIYKKRDNIKIATARAGNVIGGGDWSMDRLIPDAVKAWQSEKQHVLEPLRGYLMLGYFINNNRQERGGLSSISFNFGPRTDDVIKVEEVIKIFSNYWDFAEYKIEPSKDGAEAALLNLSYDKALNYLNWKPKLNAKNSIKLTAEWYLAQIKGIEMLDFSISQIKYYSDL